MSYLAYPPQFFFQFHKLDLIYDYKKIAYHLWCWSPFPLKFVKRMDHKLIKIQNYQSKLIVRPVKMELPTQSDPISIPKMVHRTRCIYEPTKLAIWHISLQICRWYSLFTIAIGLGIVSIKVTHFAISNVHPHSRYANF